MTFAHFENRQAQIDSVLSLPQFAHFEKTMYVGAKFRNQKRPTLHKWMRRHSDKLYCIEAYGPNVKTLDGTGLFDDVIHASVCDLPYLLGTSFYDLDLLFWWHGPEHLDFGNAIATIRSLQGLSKNVILASPFGVYEQGEEYGNPYEVHKSWFLPEDFARLGFEVSTCGRRDEPKSKSNLLAYWSFNG